MKSQNTILYFCTGLIILLIAVFVSCFLIFQNTTTVNQTNHQAKQEFLLKEYNGRLALYQIPYDTPKEIYHIYLSTLPETDQIQLKAGIPISGEAELKKYLDDFDS